MTTSLGSIAFLGSGETSQAGGRIFEQLARQIDGPLRIAVMETPAGFELNSALVAGRVADYMATRLQNYTPQIDIIPARKKNTPFSPDDLKILEPLLQANLIFMGPGSPTYAIRQLQNSKAWEIIRARHRLGATLVFASAATVAIGQSALPVYEIYKVGMDVHVAQGLDLFADFNVPLSFVPHWNNAEGGADLDTSRCFIGETRFKDWQTQIPKNHIIVGLDEHTGIIFNLNTGQASVMGVSAVTIQTQKSSKTIQAGETVLLDEIASFKLPDSISAGINPEIWKMAADAPQPGSIQEEPPPPEVISLAQARLQARANKEWASADEFRSQIEGLGWHVKDTAEGFELVKN